MKGFRPGRLIPLLLATLTMYGCSDSSGPGGSLDAQIRYVNAVRFTSGTVEIGLEGGPSAELPFEGVSEYQNTAPGIRSSFVSDESGLLRTGDVFLNAGIHNTVVYVGQQNFARGIFLTDDPGEPDAGTAFVRVVNGSLQEDAVDLYLLAADDEVDGAPAVEALGWLSATFYGGISSEDVSLVLTKVAEQDSVVFDSGPLTIPLGSIRTLLMIDGTDGIDLIVLDDDA